MFDFTKYLIPETRAKSERGRLLIRNNNEKAKEIARRIRESSGGFPCVQAIGLRVKGLAQVSMNLVNYEDTSIYVVYEMIKTLAERYGTHVVGCELVGLAPAKALIDCAEFYLKLENFDCKKQMMEYHIIDMME